MISKKTKMMAIVVSAAMLVASIVVIIFAALSYRIDHKPTFLVLAIIQNVLYTCLFIFACKYPVEKDPRELVKSWKVYRNYGDKNGMWGVWKDFWKNN